MTLKHWGRFWTLASSRSLFQLIKDLLIHIKFFLDPKLHIILLFTQPNIFLKVHRSKCSPKLTKPCTVSLRTLTFEKLLPLEAKTLQKVFHRWRAQVNIRNWILYPFGLKLQNSHLQFFRAKFVDVRTWKHWLPAKIRRDTFFRACIWLRIQ